ncbi:MAG: UDP-N-acetylmuramoyl-L-alanyl-D-glutamate--2,6-diaminopimelate ligase [Actinomycetota bacterium]|nr:UDP-N-acetylmuramoyl-L-alanyl-D-glutamate--2,6-diaminopimelate ligase [Actinomycetota bacterium]MDP2289001.1 UDP-N-acetylmuramoyl-L-alanyl-D-glutamate--2,6-diaminopimelate ligase [Actinomycetota bacterium]
MEQGPRPHSAPVVLGALQQVVPSAVVLHGSAAVLVGGVELDSRLIRSGDLFAALAGHREHGIVHATEALRNGAVALLTDDEGWASWQSSGESFAEVPVLVLDQARSWLGFIARAIYSGNAEQVQLVGVTGTNGKTTVASMVEAGMRASGMSTGFIGTTGVRIGTEEIASLRTTPESSTIHALLASMRERGVAGAAMEVSSHAMVEHRVAGLRFAAVGFANLTQDHLDYHGTMDAYFDAKRLLFTSEHADFAVVCIDDAWGERLAKLVTIPMATVSISGKHADWTVVANGEGGWLVQSPSGERTPLALALPGAFNRANAALAIALLDRIGISAAVAADALSRVQVPGRLQAVAGDAGSTDISSFVDYAHTPDAIGRVVTAVRELTEGHIIVVVGAGGDRDVVKRPLMGAMAARLADLVIVTDDNPRSEDPAAIRASVLEGARALSAVNGAVVLEVGPRKEAIQRAVQLATPGDVVLVLGKGHEQGQEIAGTVLPFDDRVELAQALSAREGARS